MLRVQNHGLGLAKGAGFGLFLGVEDPGSLTLRAQGSRQAPSPAQGHAPPVQVWACGLPRTLGIGLLQRFLWDPADSARIPFAFSRVVRGSLSSTFVPW